MQSTLNFSHNHRFEPSSDLFGFIVVTDDDQAWMYPTNHKKEHTATEVTTFKDDNGRIKRIEAKACGIEMMGLPHERGIDFTLNRPDKTTSGSIMPFRGHIVPISPTATRTRTPFETRTILSATQARAPGEVIKRARIDIASHDTTSRKKRKKSQNSVMRHSAQEAFQQFLANNKHQMTAEGKQYFKEFALKKKKKASPEGTTLFAEWCHLLGHKLTPAGKEPQSRSNLGASRDINNTRMMILEDIAATFTNDPDIDKVLIEAEFIMLNSSDIIKSIDYTVTLCTDDTTLTLHNHIDALSDCDKPRVSDRLMVNNVRSLLMGAQPVQVLAVKTQLIDEVSRAATPSLAGKRPFTPATMGSGSLFQAPTIEPARKKTLSSKKARKSATNAAEPLSPGAKEVQKITGLMSKRMAFISRTISPEDKAPDASGSSPSPGTI